MSALEDAKNDVFNSIRSDINWADGWGDTRSSVKQLIEVAKKEGRNEICELIKKVLQSPGVAGLCYSEENDERLGPGNWSVWMQDGSPAVTGETPEQALQAFLAESS